MRVWTVEAGEHAEGIEIAAEYGGDRRPLVFADTDEGYRQAFQAFKVLVVQERIGNGASYTFPGDFDIMAAYTLSRLRVVVKTSTPAIPTSCVCAPTKSLAGHDL